MRTNEIWSNFPPRPITTLSLDDVVDNVINHLEGDTVPAVFGGNGGSGFENIDISDDDKRAELAEWMRQGTLDLNPEVAEDFAANGIDFHLYEGCVQIDLPDGSWVQALLWDVDPHTYDVYYGDENNSNNEGWHQTYQYCRDYIEAWNGTDQSYFADYKGGVVEIYCNETAEVVYSEDVR